MRFRTLLLTFVAIVGSGCGAAAPVSVGNKPVSINDQPLRDAPTRPLKPVAEMSWTTFEGPVQKLKDFQGKVVLLVSVELDEIRALSDRILVMFAGRVVGERDPDATEGELGLLMAGVEGRKEAAE